MIRNEKRTTRPNGRVVLFRVALPEHESSRRYGAFTTT